MSTQDPKDSSRDLRLEVRIRASAETVWRALTEDISAWWPAEFYSGGEDGKRSYHLEAEPGGKMYESWHTGGGLLWATVVTVDPAKRLQALGQIFPEWGGPVVRFATWELAAHDGGTTLTFSESFVGSLSDKLVAAAIKGWTFLFGEALTAYVEGRPAPVWED